jgi:hypothetical protein
VDYKPKKGDLVYLPSNIMIIGEGLAQNTSVPDRWLNLIEYTIRSIFRETIGLSELWIHWR